MPLNKYPIRISDIHINNKVQNSPLGGSCHKAVADCFVTDEGNNVASIKHFSTLRCGPLIRPFGAPSPQGEVRGAPAPVR